MDSEYLPFLGRINQTQSGMSAAKSLVTAYLGVDAARAFSDNGLSLKSFVNEEIQVLKNKLNEKITSNCDRKNEFSKVLTILEDFRKYPLSEKMIEKLFYIQDLVEET